jgi:quercetin dioxygenase-like cupin family protein
MPVFDSKTTDAISPFPGFELKLLIDKNRGSKSITMINETLKPGAKIPNHRHNVEGAIYVLSGTGYLTIEGENTYKIVPGMALLVAADAYYYLGNDGNEDLKFITAHPSTEITKEEK